MKKKCKSKPTDLSAAFVTPDEGGPDISDFLTSAPQSVPSNAKPGGLKGVATSVQSDEGAPRCRQAVDVNHLARRVIAKVPAKKQESDSIEARLSRLEAAMKQFGKRSKEKGGHGK